MHGWGNDADSAEQREGRIEFEELRFEKQKTEYIKKKLNKGAIDSVSRRFWLCYYA